MSINALYLSLSAVCLKQPQQTGGELQSPVPFNSEFLATTSD